MIDTLSNPLIIVKKTKSGLKEIDIKPYVERLDVEETDNECKIYARLCARPNEYLNPDLLVKAFIDKQEEKTIDSWQVIRCAINFKEK